jgi:hypothetical protein
MEMDGFGWYVYPWRYFVLDTVRKESTSNSFRALDGMEQPVDPFHIVPNLYIVLLSIQKLSFLLYSPNKIKSLLSLPSQSP